MGCALSQPAPRNTDLAWRTRHKTEFFQVVPADTTGAKQQDDIWLRSMYASHVLNGKSALKLGQPD